MLDRDVFRVQRDGLHDVVQTPEVQAAITEAISNYFGPHAGLLELLRRFLTPGDRNDSRSYSVGTAAGGAGVAGDPGPVQLLERDPTRLQAIIQNLGGANIYVGGRRVTVGGLNDGSGGVAIFPQSELVLTGSIGELWAVSASAGQDVRVIDIAGGVGS